MSLKAAPTASGILQIGQGARSFVTRRIPEASRATWRWLLPSTRTLCRST